MKCRKFFKTISFVLSLFMIFSLCACGNKEEAEEFETNSNFEYHFFPEDFEADKEYQILLEATCMEGSMQIDVLKDGEIDTTYIVDNNSPCKESVNILPNSVSEIDIVIHIDATTKGSVEGEIKTKEK